MQVIARTQRLLLRRFTPEDAPFMLRLLNEPAFMRNVGDRGVRTPAAALAYLEQGTFASYRTHGYGPYLVQLHEGTPIGLCGVYPPRWADVPDLGYAFVPEAEGKGFATEAARAVLEFAWVTLGLDRLVAVVLPANAASIRILSKLGFQPAGSVTDARSGAELALYSLARQAD